MPALLEESLYKMTELEVRFPLNLNVLDKNRVPGVMSLKQALTAWLAFQIEVLLNRATTRIGKIDERLELLDGFLIAFLNLDRVIQIIRTEDEPKAVMIAEFALTDRQAEAILNMRLRSLRKLEEMEIAKERSALAKEREELAKLIESPPRQRTRLKRDLAAMKEKFGDERRTRIGEVAAPSRDIDWSQMIEKEPITVILSQRGWIRAMKGHVAEGEGDSLKFREGDALKKMFHAQTTDKLLLAAEDGRVYTLGGDRLPGGRGFGEPVRLSIDLAGEVEIVALMVVAARDAAAGGIERRARVPDQWRGGAGGDSQGQAIGQFAARRQGRGGQAGRAAGRCGRGDRGEPENAGVPLERAARAGAGAGGDSAALSRRRAGRREDPGRGRGAELGAGRRQRPDADRKRPHPVAGRKGCGRADAAIGFPAQQSLRWRQISACKRGVNPLRLIRQDAGCETTRTGP